MNIFKRFFVTRSNRAILCKAFDNQNIDWRINSNELSIPWKDKNGKVHLYFPDFILTIDDIEYVIGIRYDYNSVASSVAEKLLGNRYIVVNPKEIRHFEKFGWFA